MTPYPLKRKTAEVIHGNIKVLSAETYMRIKEMYCTISRKIFLSIKISFLTEPAGNIPAKQIGLAKYFVKTPLIQQTSCDLPVAVAIKFWAHSTSPSHGVPPALTLHAPSTLAARSRCMWGWGGELCTSRKKHWSIASLAMRLGNDMRAASGHPALPCWSRKVGELLIGNMLSSGGTCLTCCILGWRGQVVNQVGTWWWYVCQGNDRERQTRPERTWKCR